MFYINQKSSSSIYEQIMDNLTHLILSSAIKQGEKLPSVRKLASDLVINPNTIQKAYQMLEQQGLIYSVAGKGSFVAHDIDKIKNHKIQELKHKLRDTAKQLLELEFKKEDLIEVIKKII